VYLVALKDLRDPGAAKCLRAQYIYWMYPPPPICSLQVSSRQLFQQFQNPAAAKCQRCLRKQHTQAHRVKALLAHLPILHGFAQVWTSNPRRVRPMLEGPGLPSDGTGNRQRTLRASFTATTPTVAVRRERFAGRANGSEFSKSITLFLI
jgi:hypothetical protein